MGLPLKLAFSFLLVSGFVYAKSPQPKAKPSAEEIAAVYELQRQRGVAEKILALNELGKFEALALYRYELAKLHDKNAQELDRQERLGAILSASMFRLLGNVQSTMKNHDRIKAAEAEYAKAMKQVRAMRGEILARPSDRYVVQAGLSAGDRGRRPLPRPARSES